MTAVRIAAACRMIMTASTAGVPGIVDREPAAGAACYLRLREFLTGIGGRPLAAVSGADQHCVAYPVAVVVSCWPIRPLICGSDRGTDGE